MASVGHERATLQDLYRTRGKAELIGGGSSNSWRPDENRTGWPRGFSAHSMTSRSVQAEARLIPTAWASP